MQNKNAKEKMHLYLKLHLFKRQKKGGKMLFSFFFMKLDQMSRVGSRDCHAGWRSKIDIRQKVQQNK